MKDILLKIIEFIKKVFKAKIEEKPIIDIITPIKEEKPKEPIETKPSEVINDIPKEVEEVNTYKPRTTAPSTTDKNWIKTTKGGYNKCILIKGNSCLPNCVGYAWGRWRELLKKDHNLSRGNAENWYGNTKDGYKRGSTPKLGAVICWRKGKAGVSSDGAGHVAIVEAIYNDGSILTSNSAYGGTRFYTKKLKKGYALSSKYTFQGFIYLPIEFKEVISSYNLTRVLKSGSTGNDVKELQKELNKRGNKLTADGKFGAKTETAVKKFQKSNKLTSDGKVGKNTAHKLGWLYNNK